MEISRFQAASLAALRISLGLLLFWWGLAKVTKPKMGVGVQKKFYYDLFNSETLQYAFGYVEVAIGALVILGLFRFVAMPAQLAITGFSAATIWSALLDPFALYLPFEKIAGIQHLFYPSVIALCGAIVMLAFRKHDRYSLDHMISRRGSGHIDPGIVPAE